jgi:hypothetical protein
LNFERVPPFSGLANNVEVFLFVSVFETGFLYVADLKLEMLLPLSLLSTGIGGMSPRPA